MLHMSIYLYIIVYNYMYFNFCFLFQKKKNQNDKANLRQKKIERQFHVHIQENFHRIFSQFELWKFEDIS